jgi:DNA-binding transcriptional LysR family regulator
MATLAPVSELTLAGLRVVREIAVSGSFTAAAQALGYSQPAISRQVAAIETATGSALFVRGARGVRLSPAGRVVAEHAARVLSGVEALEQDLAGLQDRLAGRVVLGGFPTASAVLVPRTVARVGLRHPGLHISLREASSPVLLRRVRTGILDVAVIGVGEGLPAYDFDGLSPEVVFDGDLCVAVAATHRLASATRVPVAELHTEPWIIGQGSGSDPQFGVWPTLHDPRVRYAVRGWSARLGLVAAGLGISLLPELAAASVPLGVAVVGVDDPNWLGRRTVAITRPLRSSGVAAVVQALREVSDEMRPNS